MRREPLEVALVFLNRRERTVAETRQRLEREEIPTAQIDAVIGSLCEDGLLDDGRYARVFAEDRRNLDGWGAERIRRALGDRGVDRELIDAALAGGRTPAAHERRALARGRAARRRFPPPRTDRRERERALGVLLRKGYGTELALDALSACGWPRYDD